MHIIDRLIRLIDRVLLKIPPAGFWLLRPPWRD